MLVIATPPLVVVEVSAPTSLPPTPAHYAASSKYTTFLYLYKLCGLLLLPDTGNLNWFKNSINEHWSKSFLIRKILGVEPTRTTVKTREGAGISVQNIPDIQLRYGSWLYRSTKPITYTTWITHYVPAEIRPHLRSNHYSYHYTVFHSSHSTVQLDESKQKVSWMISSISKTNEMTFHSGIYGQNQFMLSSDLGFVKIPNCNIKQKNTKKGFL